MKGPAPILTFDLEDWFHLLESDAVPGVEAWPLLESRVERATDRILELLERHNAKATFFVLGWIAERHSTLVKRLAMCGHELGCHSHVHSVVHQQSPRVFREETTRALSTISQVISAPVTLYRAPGFSIDASCLWAFEALADLGVRVDCSVFPGRHAHGGLTSNVPNAPFRIDVGGRTLHEFPASVVRAGRAALAFAGGGYFRLLPLPVIRPLAARSAYTMTYFHPRDFDAGQPRLANLGWLRTFRAYVGIGSAYRKLDRFLAEFGGQTVGSADRGVDWRCATLLRLEGQRLQVV